MSRRPAVGSRRANEAPPPSTLYRQSELGAALQTAADEVAVENPELSDELIESVLQEFDGVMERALAQRVRAEFQLSGKLRSYRQCDDVWTFSVHDAKIAEGPASATAPFLKVDRLKIRVWDVRNAKLTPDAAAAAAAAADSGSTDDDN